MGIVMEQRTDFKLWFGLSSLENQREVMIEKKSLLYSETNNLKNAD